MASKMAWEWEGEEPASKPEEPSKALNPHGGRRKPAPENWPDFCVG